MLIMDLGGMRRCYCCGLEVLMKVVVLWQVWLARIRPPVAERPVPSLMIGGRPTRCHGCVVGLVLGFTIFERSTLQSFHLLSLSLSSHAVRTRCCPEVDEDSHTEWPSLELDWSMPIVSTRLPRYCVTAMQVRLGQLYCFTWIVVVKGSDEAKNPFWLR